MTETATPMFTRLCALDSAREALARPNKASPLLVRCVADALVQAWRDYSQLATEHTQVQRERDLVYGELNKALGENAPKAWDRIAAALASGVPSSGEDT